MNIRASVPAKGGAMLGVRRRNELTRLNVEGPRRRRKSMSFNQARDHELPCPVCKKTEESKTPRNIFMPISKGCWGCNGYGFAYPEKHKQLLASLKRMSKVWTDAQILPYQKRLKKAQAENSKDSKAYRKIEKLLRKMGLRWDKSQRKCKELSEIIYDMKFKRQELEETQRKEQLRQAEIDSYHYQRDLAHSHPGD
jgi:hypothetical protein